MLDTEKINNFTLRKDKYFWENWRDRFRDMHSHSISKSKQTANEKETL